MSHFYGSSFLETRPKFASLDPLNGFLAYLEPKLLAKNQKVVQISTPTNANLGWIIPIFYMAITGQQIELESCSNL